MKQRLTVILMGVGLILAAASNALAQATVTTDQPDYSPGSTAQITGTGFDAGETVQLDVLNLTDLSDVSPNIDPWTVTADTNGNFTTTWLVTVDELNSTLQLTATGLTSGLTAQTTFADGPAEQFTATVSPTTDTTGNTDSYTFTITKVSEGANTLSTVDLAIPSGYTVNSYGTPTVANNGSGGTSWTVSTVSGKIHLAASSSASNLQNENPAATVSVVANVTAPSSTGTYTWTATSSDPNGFSVSGSSPAVAVSTPPNKMIVTLPGQTFTSGSGNSGTVSTQTAGTQFTITLTLVNSGNNTTVTSYSGTKTISYSGPASSPGGTAPVYTTSVTFSSGQATGVAMTLYDAQTTTITATDGTYPGTASSSLTVNPSTANKLAMKTEPSSSVTAGGTFSQQPAVYVEDTYGNVVTSDSSSTVTASVQTGTGPLTGTTTATASAGVATFSGLAAPTLAQSGLKLTFTDSSSGSPTVNDATSITVTAGTPSKLAMKTEPSSTVGAGAAFSAQPAVYVEDTYGNVVTSDSTSTVTASVQTGTGPLTGTTTASVSSGVAMFSTLGGPTTLQTGLKLKFTDSSSGSPTVNDTTSISVTAGPAYTLTVTTQPSSTATAGQAFAQQPAVTVKDQYGNLVVDGTTVTATETSGGNLNGTTTAQTANTVSGVATFSGLYVTNAGTVTLTFTANSHTATSSSITVSAASANKLAFGVQPSTTVAGSAISPAVTVLVEDQYGNTVTTDTSSVVISSTTTAFTGSTLTNNAVSGVATFSAIKPTTVGSANTLTATDGSLTSATSSTFTVSATSCGGGTIALRGSATTASGSGTSLTISAPTGLSAGDVMIANITCHNGQGATNGYASLSGWTAIGGGVNFEGSGAGHRFLLLYKVAGSSEPTSYTFNFAVSEDGSAGGIVAFSGVNNTTPLDATGSYNSNTSGSTSISAGAISTVSANDAVVMCAASFENLTVGSFSTTSPGALTTLYGGTSLSGGTVGAGWGTQTTAGSTGAGSATLSSSKQWGAILLALKPASTVGPASKLVFTTLPASSTTAGSTMASVVVQLQDACGDNISQSGTNVTLTLSSGSFTSGSTTTVSTDSSGKATFSNLAINPAGTYTITATATSLSSAESTSFNITVGPAAQLAFTTQPGGGTGGTAWSQQPAVTLEDAGGNPVTGTAQNVTLAIQNNAGSGTLSGTKTVAVNTGTGVATFSGLSINKAGNGYTLTATGSTVDTSAGTVVSSSFNITVGTAMQLAFTTQPGGGTGGTAWTTQPAVTLEDAGGNPVTGTSQNVTLAIQNNAGSGTLSGTTTVAVNTGTGVASFSGLSINKAANGYTLTATGSTVDTSAGTIVSSGFNITVGAAAQLAFTTQPGNGTGGSAFSTQPVVTVQDLGGNTVTSSSASIALAIKSGTPSSGGPGTLSGTATLNASSGVATFSGLSINTAGTGYQLQATSSGLSTANSSTFNVTVGAAAQLAFTTQPGNGTGGSALSTQPVVTVQDLGGNTVTSSTTNVTLAIGTNPGGGTLSGTKTVAAVNGVATFSGLSIDKAGNGYTLTASGTSLAGATSGTFNITVGPAAQLAFTTQPGNGTGGSALSTQPVVTVQDLGGNTVTSSTTNVTLAIGTNPGGGTLSGTKTVAAVSGVATFSGLSIDKAGNGYTLTASGTSLAGATSGTFNITVGAASAYIITAYTATPSPGTADQLTLALVDAGGNTVTSFSGDKSLTFSGIATNADDGTAQTITSKTGSAVNIGTAEAITFASGISSSANGGAVLTAYKAQTNVTLNVSDGTLSSTSTGGAGVSLTITNVNPVVTNTYTATRQPNISLKIPISTLMTNATDANHDNISFSGVDTPTGQGATIYTNATWVLYLPANNNNDTITYSVSDGHGGTGAGTIYVNVIGNQPGGASGSISVTNGVATVKMFGIPGYQYDVQRSTDDMNSWQTVSSSITPILPSTAGAGGSITAGSDGSIGFTDNFSDLGSPPASAYYRIMGH